MYFLFAGLTYYPDGGLNDYKGMFHTKAAAQKEFDPEQFDWGHIVTIAADGTLVKVLAHNAVKGWVQP
jgi:hypothetical protein